MSYISVFMAFNVVYIRQRLGVLAKTEKRTYSRYTDEALKLLAGRIKATRLERGITVQDLAERAGISVIYSIALSVLIPSAVLAWCLKFLRSLD